MTADVLAIAEGIAVPLGEISLSAIRSRGPGGQNVNKVSTAMHLRFDIDASAALPEEIKDKLRRYKDRRISADGIVVIKSQRYRSQEKNRADALARLQALLREALIEKKPRKKTQPNKRAKQKRLDSKTRRGRLKQSRGRISDD